MNDDFEAYADQVRAEHYLHWLALAAATIWIGTIYGFLAGLGALIGLVVAISLTNMLVLAKTGSLRATKLSRWGWVVLAFVAIIISSAEVHAVQP